jgi:hypothetical protein
MNASSVKTKDYENEIAFWPAKNKPKTNPISKATLHRLVRGNLVKMGNHELLCIEQSIV